MFLLIRKGSDNNTETRHVSAETAKKVAEKEIASIKQAYYLDSENCYVETRVDSEGGMIKLTADQFYQSWLIVREPKTDLEKALILVELARCGAEQYTFELEDVCVCDDVLCELGNLLRSVALKGGTLDG